MKLKLHMTGPLWGESTSHTAGFPSQRASNVESKSISWRHHESDTIIIRSNIWYWKQHDDDKCLQFITFYINISYVQVPPSDAGFEINKTPYIVHTWKQCELFQKIYYAII